MSDEAVISPALFGFLRELKANNDREWFQANRDRYESTVREPLLRFIADFGPLLEEISPHYLADPRPSGGSMFRIHRDTRFSRDKSPYKTHAALHFRHLRATRDVHAPGFYLHLEPGGCFMGAGIWRPTGETLDRIRRSIADRPAAWLAVVRGVGSVQGDRLQRPPRGYDPTHPLIDDLKLKDFLTTREFTEAEVCTVDFPARYAAACQESAPLMSFLTAAVGLEWD